MLISTALAHGTAPGESGGGYGPLVLLAVAAVVILGLALERKIRKEKSRR